MNGLFLSFEGVEGSGKTTQAKLLAEKLSNLGYDVVALREPGGTPIGEEIRKLLIHSEINSAMSAETELLLMTASRAQLVRQVIMPSLKRGAIVICDRFYDSTVAYQGYGRGLPVTVIQDLIAFAIGDVHPQITILLNVSLDLGAARVCSRQAALPKVRDRIGESDRVFFERVEQGFKAAAAGNSARVHIVDGTPPVETVRAAVFECLKPLLSANSHQ